MSPTKRNEPALPAETPLVTAGMKLQALSIDVCRQGRLILEDVSFVAEPATLTGIIGPNGAGKTTLMRALSGERPDGGRVLVNEHDLYQAPEYWLQQIGYVPVDNILHEHLTLEEALMYIGRLRLPRTPAAQIRQRVDELLTDFGFPSNDDRRHKQMRVLSSGERKRASVCSELVIDPPILMLDEPTSNLDPNAEYNLMRLLADYAHKKGKTILVITHTLNTIELCDQVIYIENSRLRATGAPAEVLATLEGELPHTIDSGASSFTRWALIFDETKTRADRRRCRRGGFQPGTGEPPGEREAPTAPWIYQLTWLLKRYMRVRLGDPGSFVGTLLAGVSGILFFTLPGRTFVMPFEESERALALNQARQSIYVVALVVTLLGLITSYTEISKEFRIYRHERLKGLSPSAYFMSKWLWLVVAVGILAPVLLLAFIVLVYGQPLPGFPELSINETVGAGERLVRFQLVGLLTARASWLTLLTLILACITSVTLGLLISALAGDGGRGYLYLSFVVVFIVLFSGLIRNQKLEHLIDTLSFASAGKWAYEGLASTIGVYCWLDSWRFDEFNSTGHIISIWLALVLFTLVAAFLTVLVLRARDPWYSRLRNLKVLVARQWKPILILVCVILLLFSHTVFLRQLSREYHALNYWSRAAYGGSGAYEYAGVNKLEDPDWLQFLSGRVSQSWCNME